jgi:hypothetical protein
MTAIGRQRQLKYRIVSAHGILIQSRGNKETDLFSKCNAKTQLKNKPREPYQFLFVIDDIKPYYLDSFYIITVFLKSNTSEYDL